MWAAMVKKDVAPPVAGGGGGATLPATVAPEAVTEQTTTISLAASSAPSAHPVVPSALAPTPTDDITASKTVSSVSKRRVVVVDTGAIIKGLVFSSALADEFVTVPEVVSEVRDVEARRRLETMPVKLELRVPSKDALLRVIQACDTHLWRYSCDVPHVSVTDMPLSIRVPVRQQDRRLRDAVKGGYSSHCVDVAVAFGERRHGARGAGKRSRRGESGTQLILRAC